MTTRHVYRVYIRATAEQVWTALVDPSFTREWFLGTAFDAPPQQGQPYRATMSNGASVIDGIVEVCEPPRRLVQTWHVLHDAAMSEEPPSRVEWTITDAGEGVVQLDLVHGDLARSPLTWAHVQHQWVVLVDSLKSLLETGSPLPSAVVESTPVASVDPTGDWHRAQGIECNNSTWEMIEAERTPANDEEMLRRAYASAYHWQRAARRGPENEARALWMLAKVHLLAGNPGTSLEYADACAQQCADHGLADFDLAYAYEARARALQALGRAAEAEVVWAAAKAVPIADPEDQAIVDADLATGP